MLGGVASTVLRHLVTLVSGLGILRKKIVLEFSWEPWSTLLEGGFRLGFYNIPYRASYEGHRLI